MTYEYFSGRTKKSMLSDSIEENETASLFDEEIIDHNTFSDKSFHQCTFSTLVAKDVKFNKITFQNCVFLDCYLNQSNFRTCRFIGCKFIRCSFTMVEFHESTMQYCRFYECGLSYGQARELLTNNASDSYRFLRNLYEQNKRMGHWESANKLLTISIDYQETHWRKIFTASNTHYRNNYSEIQRKKYRLRYYQSRFSGFLWGHGLKPWRALRSLFISVAGYSCVLYTFSPLAWAPDSIIPAVSGSLSAALVSMMPFAGLSTNHAYPVDSHTHKI